MVLRYCGISITINAFRSSYLSFLQCGTATVAVVCSKKNGPLESCCRVLIVIPTKSGGASTHKQHHSLLRLTFLAAATWTTNKTDTPHPLAASVDFSFFKIMLLAWSPRTLLLLFCFGLHTTCFPFEDRALSPGNSVSTLQRPSKINNSSSLLLDEPRLGDWEHFVEPIPNTKRVFRGRIFTDRPIRPSALHFMIDGGLATASSRLDDLGNINLVGQDNPFVYRVPGCHFQIRSKTSDGKALMTYAMLIEVFKALEKLLEKGQRFFATSFVLTDYERVSW